MSIVSAIEFEGSLRDAERTIPVQFSAEVDEDGKLQFAFRDPEPTADAFRLVGQGFSRGDGLRYFHLEGTGSAGETIASDTFHVASYSHRSDDTGSHLSFGGGCREADLILPLEGPVARPTLIWATRRFQSFSGLQANLLEGAAWMGGAKPEASRPQRLTGGLKIRNAGSEATEVWWSEAEQAAEHVFRVMSLACGVYLRPYLQRRVAGQQEHLKVSAYSDAPESFLPPFHFLNLEPIFACACSADAAGREQFKRLDAALQWLLSPAHYDEIRLLTAMTALENVVEETYPSDAHPIIPKPEFKRFEKQVKALIRDAKLPTALEAKVQELNRLSFAEKLARYLDAHDVVVADISAEKFAAVIKARNGVVHRGVYPHDEDGQPDIWQHIVTAREVLIRIFLHALNFEGNYFSNLHRDNQLRFPSCRRLADASGCEIPIDDPRGEPGYL